MAAASSASAQPTGQLWSNVTVDWLQTKRLTWEIDVEPKQTVRVPGGKPSLFTLDINPSVEYTLNPWVDTDAELLTGYTDQSNGDDTFEATARVGLHLHILSRLLAASPRSPAEREKPPRRRLVPAHFIRLEYQNQIPTHNSATTTTWRLRDRSEIAYPLNRPKITADGAVYLTGDVELFLPLADPSERFINQCRIRAGMGYRHSFAWRFEGLFVQTRARKSGDSAFATSTNAFDIRIKRVF